MSSADQIMRSSIHSFRDWFADSLGVGPERKAEIYLEITQSTSLRDVSYWLQLLFSAGIATLGLVLNSTAVIIGAMLISPLMGPILASGLALAAGDLILGLRALTSLVFSCLIAAIFAMLLVYFLPFKEQTAEIAARTHPNTLDLVVALFSGAVGSLAICKKVKGVVTSIPGVAIAVALMPPLCVMGFGLGVAISENGVSGMEAARGGGLLFLTNLVAITFTSMLVFLALHIDTSGVRAIVRQWRNEEDLAGRWLRIFLIRFPGADRLKKIGSLPGRVLLILVVILLIFFPLSRSLSQLRAEIAEKKSANMIRRAATDVWQQKYSRLPDGSQRSYIGPLSMTDTSGQLKVLLRVYTVKPLTAPESAEYTRLVAERIGRPVESVSIQLIEIPTASSEMLLRAKNALEQESRPEPIVSVAQLQEEFTHAVESSLVGLQMPPPAQLLGYEVMVSPGSPLRIRLFYLSNRDIEMDAQNLIAKVIKDKLTDQAAQVTLERVESSYGPLGFFRNQAGLNQAANATLERVGTILREYPKLNVEIIVSAEQTEREGTAAERSQSIAEFLTSKYLITPDRITSNPATSADRNAMLFMKMAEASK